MCSILYWGLTVIISVALLSLWESFFLECLGSEESWRMEVKSLKEHKPSLNRTWGYSGEGIHAATKPTWYKTHICLNSFSEKCGKLNCLPVWNNTNLFSAHTDEILTSQLFAHKRKWKTISVEILDCKILSFLTKDYWSQKADVFGIQKFLQYFWPMDILVLGFFFHWNVF